MVTSATDRRRLDATASYVKWIDRTMQSGKFNQIKAICGLLNHDVIALTETKALVNHTRAKEQLVLQGYSHLACTRTPCTGSRRSGGVSVFVRDELAPCVRGVGLTNAPVGVEIVWLRFHSVLPGGRALLLGTGYCSPQGSSVYSSTDGSGLVYSEAPDTAATAVFGSITGELDSRVRH
ncbi:hypothetical protein VOLCADRAFT_87673 [Volvox carteri f. nagariensis]|uniref:Uncharacterized protein n=1 Tax=Volvox carteri f. nagariensis TaxID=3068 RepID=D8TLY5_VOLCA|nr:uncharacterized protein VOLCADRAFT_87673 [Volvox carteri f. nagariensis]EFJ51414.1 hypothetical protein VOLCADRAFT_87673 [Volvox carteri f. nagariensis]|eukprot:XP_002947366.1 hypothetical protein VOLCADRAFT_87673 [Volvox carteri f. nagariensis]